MATKAPKQQIDLLLDTLKTRKLRSPRRLALETFEAFRGFLKENSYCEQKEMRGLLINYVREITNICRPHAIVAENIALRILKIAGSVDQCPLNTVPFEEEKSWHYLLESRPACKFHNSESSEMCPVQDSHSYSALLEEELDVFSCELTSCLDDVSSQAIQHIHSNETVMIYGHSGTVEAFLKNAAKRRKFKVIVCQSSPDEVGHKMVEALSPLPNVEITLIPDSCIFAMMARVNKVILSCYSISADGGLISRSGTNALALAAASFGVPILVCTGLYKLSPRYQNSSTVFGRDIDYSLPVCPQPILDYYTASSLGNVKVLNPSFDYIPANLITLFVTNRGSLSPSYMYRLLNELYPVNEPQL